MKKQKKIAKSKYSYLIDNNYFQLKKKFGDVIAFKMIISLIISSSFIMIVLTLFSIDFSTGIIIGSSLIFTLIFCCLFTFLNKDKVALGFFASVVLFLLYFYKKIQIRLYLSSFIMHFLDSKYFDTAERAAIEKSQLTELNTEYVQCMSIVLLFFAYLTAFIVGYFTYARGKTLFPFIYFSILISPAFLSLKADFNIWFVPLVACLMGNYSTYSMYAYYNEFNFPIKKDEKQNKKLVIKKSKAPWFKNTYDKLINASKYQSAVFIVAILTVISLTLSAFIMPKGSSINYENLYEWVNKKGWSIDNNIFNTDSEFFTKYFTTNYGGFNNTLGITSPSNGNKEVLKVITDSNKETKYLRADIGINFLDNYWTSAGNYNNPFAEDLDKPFYPEFIPCIASSLLDMMTNFNGSNFFKSENVNIEYLMDTDVVFMPTSMVDFTMFKNEDLKYSGDSILRSKENHLESISFPMINTVSVETPNYSDIFEYLSQVDESVIQAGSLFSPYMSEEQISAYLEQKEQYDLYVKNMYTTVPDEFYYFLNDFLKDEIFKNDIVYPDTIDEVPILKLEQAIKINNYLKYNYKYSLDAVNNIENVNPIYYFLSVSKEGHCALYASSMVLLMRTLGYPARYVTGFITSGEGTQTSDGKYEYILKEKNLHAWVEVYFDELGWVSFDPTGFSNTNDENVEFTEQTTSPQTTEASTEQPTALTTNDSSVSTVFSSSQADTSQDSSDNSDSKDNNKNDLVIIIIIIALVLLVMIAFLIFIIMYSNKRHKSLFAYFSSSNDKKVISHMYSVMYKLLYLEGFKPEDNELPEEFAKRMQLELFDERKINNFHEIMMIFMKNEFSSSRISDSEYKILYNFLVKLYSDNVLNKNILVRTFYKLIIK